MVLHNLCPLCLGGDEMVEHLHLPPLPGQDRPQTHILHPWQGDTHNVITMLF